MTIKAADWLKIDLDGDLNEGLDALVRQPTLAIKGPYAKSRLSPLQPASTQIKSYSYWENQQLVRSVGPRKDLYQPRLLIPCPGQKSGYWNSSSSRIEQIWWFRTPPECRPPLYRSKEELERRALRNYQNRIVRRIDRWSKSVGQAYDKFIEWKSRKLLNLERASSRIRTKRRLSQRDKQRLNEIAKKQRETAAQQFRTGIRFNVDEFGVYKAKYLDFWTHKYADDKRRWLCTPRPTYVLPVWHLKLGCGYTVATLDHSYEATVINSSGSYDYGWRREIRDWEVLTSQAPSGLFDKQVHYDEDALLDAVNDMLPRTKVRSNIIVTAVELREFGNLLSEMKTILKELRKAVLSYQRTCKQLKSIFHGSKQLVNYAMLGKAHRSAMRASPDWKRVKQGVTFSVDGCAEAAQFLASRHLAWRFGDPDSVRALEGLWNLFHDRFEKMMKPLYTALAAAGTTTSRHRTILDVIDQTTTELPTSTLFSEMKQYIGQEDQSVWYPDAWPLAPTGIISNVETVSRIQKVTLITKDVLVDSFGGQVGVDEAVTRYIMDLVGLNFNPKTVWDLIPYSFVIDWFVDVGSILERYCSLTNLRFVSTIEGGCVSELFRYAKTSSIRGQAHSTYYEELWRDSDDSYEFINISNNVGLLSKPLVAKVYRRNPVPTSVLEKGRLRFNWDDYLFKGIGGSQLLCGVELLMQRIKN